MRPVFSPAKWLALLLVSAWSGDAAPLDAGSPTQASVQAVKGRDHWSFQPVKRPPIPETLDTKWARNDLDRFILARLEQDGLRPSAEADRVTWLRRIYFDVIGLPPTPEQVMAFVNDERPDAHERVVDGLLSSPRYGERWAQHWLDVVRYADTDGFEVNTERPNAWPYRDYVIGALNQDIPYDRFIREQLAGDASAVDAATGFLVAAAALLPGQIGADDISKRLARQDSLSEIVGATGQTFLGLSIGCARCHDHKFDPIPQRDYYAIQAFFAGVQYGERPLRSPENDLRRKEIEEIKVRETQIDRALSRLEPMARASSQPRRETNARLNEEIFSPLEAKFVRLTIHDVNLHPTLGVIEPCLDEFEIFTSESAPRNVALTSLGAKVTASGSHTSESHRLEHINDGQYGNSHSWISDEPGRGWVLFELPEKARVGKVIWGRDREGKFADRLATAYTLEAGLSLDAMTTLISVAPLRPAVNPRQTTDRFDPVVAQRLRLSISACTSLQPCLDELEVFTSEPEPRNIALASAGTKVTASSTLPDSPIHQLKHINDGVYGNANSWISNEEGQGWIELEFSSPQKIDRVVWGRDREEKFVDRLATDYRIEVADASGKWSKVAGSQDRQKYVAGDKKVAAFSLVGLNPGETKEATRLLSEKKALEKKTLALSTGLMVYAGSFTNAGETHVLHRGDPEQPRDLVGPAVLTALGSFSLPSDSAEQDRRVALASWIGDPANPLTSRVMVNRIWQGHFGIGLVETSSDFGHTGALPSHPALLDWLAGEFFRSGWSIKHMHRLILMSATFRQSSRINRASQAIDADARLLWRFPARRLDAETIRDSMLSVNDRLNLKMGGAGFNLFNSRGGLNGFPPVESFSNDGLRRMIYAHKVRMERDSVFGAFDCPDAGQSTSRRRPSTSPLQALNLFNSRFTLEESEAFAKRVQTDAGADDGKQISRAYQLAFGREPDSSERQDAEPVLREHGLTTLCRVLFNSNEFLFLP